MLNVEYVDHCGYIVETDVAVYIFDYVEGLMPGHYLRSEKPTYFFVTTADRHHFSDAIFSFRKPVFLSQDVLASPFNNVYKMEPGDTFHMGQSRIAVLKTTRSGVGYLIEEDHVTFLHGGDLNNWHWSSMSSDDEVKAETKAFHEALNQIVSNKSLDLMMVSIDPRMGEDYDRGAREMIKQMKPRYVFPMHFGPSSNDLSSFYEWAQDIDGCTVFKPNYTNHTFKNIE